MNFKIETVILQNLINNEEYMRKVIPFLKREYFTSNMEQQIYDEVKKFIDEYNTLPSRDALVIAFQNNRNLNEEQYKEVIEYVNTLETTNHNKDWLLDQTEKFCKDKAIYNAILSSISIIDGRNKNLSTDGIPSLLQEALAVCFDNNVGHDYIDNANARYDFYHKVESRIPFDLDYFNKITNGGLPNKTLNVVLAGCVHPNTKVRIRFKK